MQKELYFTFISLLFTLSISGRIPGDIDTAIIYKNQSGVRYRLYEKIWFRTDDRNSYFIKDNSQDRLVLDTISYYFKVYDRKKRLLFEGAKNGQHGWLQGKVIHYYKNGNVKRTEYRDYHNTNMNYQYMLENRSDLDTSYKWQYYRANGTLKKQKTFSIEKAAMLREGDVLFDPPYQFVAIPQTTFFKRNGQVQSVKLYR